MRRKGTVIRKLRPHLVIEMDGGLWTTSAKDPGETCPKCGAPLVWSDETLFCDRGFMGATACNFQYTLTEEEMAEEERKRLALEDEEARKKVPEILAQQGRPVFGVTPAETFMLPSELEKRHTFGITITIREQ